MAAKTIRLRALASADLDAAADHYVVEAGDDIALSFVDAVEHVADRLGRSPQLGTLRFAYELGLPGLRAIPVNRFPYLVFYVERDDQIDVWRVLHTSRDVANIIHDDSEG